MTHLGHHDNPLVSIGISTIEVVRQHPNEFKIVLASSNNNYSKLLEFAVEFNIPELVITNSALKQKITDIPTNSNLTFGEDELQRKIESVDCDIILNAISGSAGLRSSITTISKGIDLALANKESLIMAGDKIMDMIGNSNTNLIPVDSEHSASLSVKQI